MIAIVRSQEADKMIKELVIDNPESDTDTIVDYVVDYFIMAGHYTFEGKCIMI